MTMNNLQGIARLKIHPGKLEEFKRLAARCMESARVKDTGALQYDWFFNSEDGADGAVLRCNHTGLSRESQLGRSVQDLSGELRSRCSKCTEPRQGPMSCRSAR